MTSFSIITATYNVAATIADCLESVARQTCPATEHIIIDGASTDNTLDVISSLTIHPSTHLRIYSEPDNGIYDAMNKGIVLATGDVIGILNADDFYASADVLAKVAAVFEDPTVMCCYGDLEYVKEAVDRGQRSDNREQNIESKSVPFKVVRYWKSGEFSPDKFYWGWMPPHPTFFARRSMYEKYGMFRLDLGTAADYELMLRFMLKERISTVYIPEILVRMRSGGVSNRLLLSRLKAHQMDRKSWEMNRLSPYFWTLFMKPLRKLRQYKVFSR